MQAEKIIPASESAQTATPAMVDKYAVMFRRLGGHVEAYGENGEFGWQHPCREENDVLYVAKLDCLWAGLEELADYLKREGFPSEDRP